MHQVICSSDFPLQLLMEMKKDHPEILKSTQFVVTLSGEQLIQLTEMQQRASEALLEKHIERIMRGDKSLQYVTTKELQEIYKISPTRANELQHMNVFTDIIKIGRQNAYSRVQVEEYMRNHRHSKYG